MSEPSLSTLRKLCDTTLKSDDKLAQLYDVKAPLASGVFAGCTEIVHKETGVHYAMRSLPNLEVANSSRKCRELCDSISAQRRLADEAGDADFGSVARLHEVVSGSRTIMVISELPPQRGRICTDLLSMIEKQGSGSGLSEHDAQQIFAGLVLATKWAHEHGVVVRNIKPETVQVQQLAEGAPWQVLLSDMHCAALTTSDDPDEGSLTGLHGTPEYAAPEVVIWFWHESEPPQLPDPPPPYGVKADVWSLGICLHVMLSGCFPFNNSQSDEGMLRAINAAEFSFNDFSASQDARDLVGQLLQRDPLDRPFLEEVLQHPFCASAVQMAEQSVRRSTLKGCDFDNALAALEED